MGEKIVVSGNCQMNVARRILQVIKPNYEIDYINISEVNKLSERELLSVLRTADLCIVQSLPALRNVVNIGGGLVLEVPFVTFMGSQPDCVYLQDRDVTDFVKYDSRIIAAAFLSGFDENQCIDLFCENVYDQLGYRDIFVAECRRLEALLDGCHMGDLVGGWVDRQPFMYTINHPKMFVIEDMLKEALKRGGVSYNNVCVHEVVSDPLIQWCVWPSLFDRAGNVIPRESLFFKGPGDRILDVEEFVVFCYEKFGREGVRREQLWHPSFSDGGLENIEKIFKKELAGRGVEGKAGHPYKGKPDYCFWRKSISSLQMSAIDPVVRSDLSITRRDKVATAGSCFAQHIAEWLKKAGFNYFVVEKKPDGMDSHQAETNGFGVFSARYGNVYTVRQLVQLFDRAFGLFNPEIAPWRKGDGYVDPFRPTIPPGGYSTKEEVMDAQSAHLALVRRMFQELDVFVFTLGLTECWEYIPDGAILPLAPGVAGGEMDWDKYRFRNFTKDEVQKDLEMFVDKLNEVNPGARVVLTVSPVPLMATFEDRHVLVSTTVSKSILRVVAEEVSSAKSNVFYFPSYEIITGNYNRGSYYESDLREVSERGVAHVMELFLRHCTRDGGSEDVLNRGDNFAEDGKSDGFTVLRDEEVAELNQVVCEEEMLDV